MKVRARRGVIIAAIVCTALAAGCTDAGDSDTRITSAACEYIEAVLAGDQSQVDALTGDSVDLETEADALAGWIGIDQTGVSGSAADDVFTSANGDVLWTGTGADGSREWAVDVVVKVGGLAATDTIRVFGLLTPESDVVVERLGQAP